MTTRCSGTETPIWRRERRRPSTEQAEDELLEGLGVAALIAGGQDLGPKCTAAGPRNLHRGGHAANVDVAPVEAVRELGIMLAQMGLPFAETDAGEDHAEQLV